MECDVLVIGAGLAGLQCARVLQRVGLSVQVWEAADQVGGRVRTEQVDGFRLDRGFQVLNPAYPAVRRGVDVPALRLQPFAPGVAVRREDRRAVVADPRRAPHLLAAVLRSGYVRPRELAQLTRWIGPALGPPSRLTGDRDTTLARSLDAAGVHGPIRAEIIEPFLAGVLLEEDGSTSAGFARLLTRAFLRGTPGLPAEGMQALPRQLAAHLTGGIRFEHPAEAVRPVPGGVRVAGPSGTASARAAVIATDPVVAGRLAGVEVPPMKGLVTYWFAASERPAGVPMIILDGRGRVRGQRPGPVINTAVISNVAPTYAPPGQHLVQATCQIRDGETVRSEDEVRRHLADIYEQDTGTWALLARHVVPEAVPAQPAPLRLRRSVEIGDGMYVCGDHRDTASIQGALVSGSRTARLVARRLAAVT